MLKQAFLYKAYFHWEINGWYLHCVLRLFVLLFFLELCLLSFANRRDQSVIYWGWVKTERIIQLEDTVHRVSRSAKCISMPASLSR